LRAVTVLQRRPKPYRRMDHRAGGGSSAATARNVSGFLIRVYAQAQDDKLRARSLYLIDNLIAHEAYGIEQVMDELAR
jgi:hypothetical protein